MQHFKRTIGTFTPLVRVYPTSPPLHGQDFPEPNNQIRHGSEDYRMNDGNREKWNDPEAISKAKRGNVRGLAHPKISHA